jgi:hypothetical protein
VNSRFERTYRTSLADNELILFDALFDVWDTPESLLPANFRSAFNLPYTHDLDPAALRITIEGLIERRLIQRRVERAAAREIVWLALTPAGGELWALEREPAWDCFCQDASWPIDSPDGPWMMCIRSPSLETARAFLESGIQCGLYAVTPQAITEATTREALIPWRPFPTIYELRAALATPQAGVVDWALYERERRWWRTIPELATLQGRPRTTRWD